MEYSPLIKLMMETRDSLMALGANPGRSEVTLEGGSQSMSVNFRFVNTRFVLNWKRIVNKSPSGKVLRKLVVTLEFCFANLSKLRIEHCGIEGWSIRFLSGEGCLPSFYMNEVQSLFMSFPEEKLKAFLGACMSEQGLCGQNQEVIEACLDEIIHHWTTCVGWGNAPYVQYGYDFAETLSCLMQGCRCYKFVPHDQSVMISDLAGDALDEANQIAHGASTRIPWTVALHDRHQDLSWNRYVTSEGHILLSQQFGLQEETLYFLAGSLSEPLESFIDEQGVEMHAFASEVQALAEEARELEELECYSWG